MSEMDTFVKDFLVESHENLDRLDRDLIELEENPSAAGRLASVFRVIHTLKGTSGFFGFSRLGALAHAGEALLSRLRDGVLLLDAEMTSSLLAMVDAVREMLSKIEKTGQEGDGDYRALIERLTVLGRGKAAVSRAADQASLSSGSAEVTLNAPAGATDLQGDAPTPPLGELLVQANLVDEREVNAALEKKRNGDPRLVGEILVAQGALEPGDLADALEAQKQFRSPSLAGNIRVDVEQLDKLMNLVGELVLVRNQILRFSTVQQDASFLSATQHLNLITTELQEGVMKTRMQPIDNIWKKFPRMVRDLAIHFGKRVQLEMEGRETELDRTLVEAVRDPLTHVVRNSVDHGIETPEKRVAAGKTPEGRLLLRAFHEGGLVNIEISDDGAGMDQDRIKQRAVELGLITPEKARTLEERDTLNLIFLPGFSTAEKVTDISGRGVGMDVVKTNIEKVGGMVEVQSKPGQGTTLKIRIPLTLAIIPALIVTSGGEQYAIPQTSLLELVRLEGEEARPEMIHGTPVYRLRGNLLPLVYLNQELGGGPPDSEGAIARAEAGPVATIVVLHADNQQFGLVVDELNDTGEIVVKPLGKQLKGISTFAGAMIMGDGKVALILDVLGLAQRARVLSEAKKKRPEIASVPPQAAADYQNVLLFTAGGDSPMAIPLSLVTRLEEFPRSSVERTGTDEVVQYRGEILPIIDLCSLLPKRQPPPSPEQPDGKLDEKIQVIVYSGDGRRAGFRVERILDIVEDRLVVQYPPTRKGSLGSAVIQGRVAEVLDVEGIINAAGSSALVRQANPLAGG